MTPTTTTQALAATTAATLTNSHEENKRLSLLEREKLLRRNSKHYGHKTHKKKYKDYLHYSSVMMMRHPSEQHQPFGISSSTSSSTTRAPQTWTTSPHPHVEQQSTASTKLIKMDNTKHHDEDEDNLRFHRDRYAKKLKMEKTSGGGLSPPSPIFLLKSTQRGSHPATIKPTFYEGQINYYLETEDDDDALLGGGRGNEARFITKGDRMDANDWYRRLSPVLRNGVKSSAGNQQQDDRTVGGKASTAAISGGSGYTPYHHYRNHHQRHHHHQNHHSSRNHAYQRKMIPKKPIVTTTPMPPPSRKHSAADETAAIQELGHQITDLKEFERYYAKWPHLARVQSQLHDEQLREQLELQNLQQQQMGNYQDYEYDEDYFEALQGIGMGGMNDQASPEENLPPYIRKYNRRNKQLLDLLEGTLPPPTRPPPQLRWSGSKLQPGPRDSSVGSMAVRIDDDYLKEKRKRYHQRQKQIHDLFEQQRGTTTTQAPTPYPYVNSNDKENQNNNESPNELENHLPDEDVSISMETQEHFDSNADEHKIWQKEIASKSSSAASTAKSTAFLSSSSSNPGNSPIHWQMEKLITPSPRAGAIPVTASTTSLAPTPKPAIFKLPSYPSIAGSYIQRPRSRSAQFAPSSGSEYRRVTPNLYGSNSNSNFINAGGFVAYNGHSMSTNGKSMAARFTGTDEQKHTTSLPPLQSSAAGGVTSNTSKSNSNQGKGSSAKSSSSSSPSSASSSSPASVSNSFVYHRVVDASPRLVGAGLTGRKQRLPFVAITDRRLETSKKSLTDHQKDFEQNHYPLP